MLRDPLCERLARLAAMDGPLRGHVFDLDGGEWSIGRGRGNRLTVDDPSLSRQHCRIEYRDGTFRVQDLDSHNGTFVNGLPARDHELRDGDEIKAGGSLFRFLDPDSSAIPVSRSVRFEGSDIGNPTLLLLRSEGSIYLKPGVALEAAPGAGMALPGYQAVLRLAAALHATCGPEALAGRLLEVLLDSLPATRAAVLLFHAAGEEPHLACTLDRAAGPGAPVDASLQAVERAFREGCALVSANGKDRAAGLMAAPLPGRNRTLGVIYLDSDVPGVFAAEHLQLLAAVGVVAGAALENALELSRVEEENRGLREEIRIRHEMVGESPRMQEVYRLIARAAPTDCGVLVLGETGTGKELVARAIHRNSPRAAAPFIAINCAALTDSLLESELFGYERGAFTGAVTQKKGRIELADHGTLFLDEIGELPLALQGKLLRVLQTREFERVGGTRTIHVDVRIVAATNRDLRSLSASGAFRDDLYYRLNVVTIRLPALRERREDIPLLASYFLATRAAGARKVAGISEKARSCLMAYDWPGNIRELQHAIESAVVLGADNLIQPEDLPEAVLEAIVDDVSGEAGYHASVKQQKCKLILAALSQSGGRITEAARSLGLHPNYLHRLIRSLGLRAQIRDAAAR